MERMGRVNQMMKREISNILQREVQEPRLNFVTITSVVVSPDLHTARVNFSVMGSVDKTSEIKDALNKASGFIRRYIGKRIKLRFTPELEFFYDPSIEYSVRVEQTIQKIKEEKLTDK